MSHRVGPVFPPPVVQYILAQLCHHLCHRRCYNGLWPSTIIELALCDGIFAKSCSIYSTVLMMPDNLSFEQSDDSPYELGGPNTQVNTSVCRDVEILHVEPTKGCGTVVVAPRWSFTAFSLTGVGNCSRFCGVVVS